jgi:hypothetical protein
MRRRDFLGAAASAAAVPLLLPGTDVRAAAPTLPKRAIGANYFDLFYRSVYGTAMTLSTATTALSQLKAVGIPFVRFACSPYWPSEWKKTYMANPTTYLANMDVIFNAAQSVGMGLVPSMIWNFSSIPDALGEPMSAWGNASSATRTFMRNYVGTVVKRYASNSAIWIWEFENEVTDWGDLPNALTWWPAVNTANGTPATRTNADLITSAMIKSALADFASVVRQYDTRQISSGANIPRNNAFHLSQTPLSWTLDTPEQFTAAVGSQTLPASSGGVASMHLYPFNLANSYVGVATPTYSTVLTAFAAAAKSLGVPSFVGEFGIPQTSSVQTDLSNFTSLLNNVVSSGVNYAAMWVYDFTFQNGQYNMTLTNNYASFVKLVGAANAHL